MVHEEQNKNKGDRKLHEVCKARLRGTLSSTKVENIWKCPRDSWTETQNKSIFVTFTKQIDKLPTQPVGWRAQLKTYFSIEIEHRQVNPGKDAVR